MARLMRFAVAVVLAGFTACPAMAMDRKPLPMEVQLLRGDADARLAAAKKLAMEKDPATAESLTAALKDNEPLVKRFAIYGLQRIGNPAAASAIEPLVKDPDSWVRRTAIKALGNLRSKPSAPVLVEALKDEDLLVRVAAFVALGLIGDPGSQKALVEAAREPCLWTELRVGDQQLILEALSPPAFTDPALKELLVKLLDYGRMPHPEFEGMSDDEADDAVLQISNQAALMLAKKFHDASGEAWLIKGVENINNDFMMQASIKALATLKSRKGTPAIVKLLERAWTPTLESFKNNDRYCIEALGQIGDPDTVAPLERFLTHPDYRLRQCAAAALEKIDGRKREFAPDGPAAVIPQIAEKNLGTPGGKRPPQFIVLAVDDCANLEGVEAMLDICQTLKAQGSKAVFTMYLAPLLGQPAIRRLADRRSGEEESDLSDPLRHGLRNRAPHPAPQPGLDVAVEGPAGRGNRGVHAVGSRQHRWFHAAVLVQEPRRRARRTRATWSSRATSWPSRISSTAAAAAGIPTTSRGRRPGEWPMRISSGSLDAEAPPVHATITDGILSDYPGRFDFELADGVAMWKANFDYHYNHPRRPILAFNAFHDWALKHLDDPNDKGTPRNERKILKAFLLDVLVKNKDKYPDTYCVTFRQVVEYVNTNGDLKQTLAIGNGQDSRNPVKPSVQ